MPSSMMKALFLFLATAAFSFALPNVSPSSAVVEERHDWDDGHCSDVDLCPDACDSCLSDHQARKLAATWLYFSVNIDRRIADRTLTHNFTLHSDSDNTAGITGVSTSLRSILNLELTWPIGYSASWCSYIWESSRFHQGTTNWSIRTGWLRIFAYS
jgi:hypothetical protein